MNATANARANMPPRRVAATAWARMDVLIAAVILALILLPAVQWVVGYRLGKIVAFLIVVWFAIVSIELPGVWYRVLTQRWRELRLYAVWLALIFAYAILDPTNLRLHETMGDATKLLYVTMQIGGCYAIALVYSTERGGRSFRWLMTFTIIATALNAMLSLPAMLTESLGESATMAREFINTYQSADVAKPSVFYYGLGDVGLYCAYVVLAPFMMYMALHARGLSRSFYWLLFAVLVASTFTSSLLAMVVVLVASTILYLLTFFATRGVPMGVRLRVLLLAVLVAGVWNQLSSRYPIEYSVHKMAYLVDPSYSGPVEGNTIEKRQMLYMRSIETFILNPLVGAGGTRIFKTGGKFPGIGGHSGILDGFAMYGLLFLSFLVFLGVKYRHLQAAIRENPKSIWLSTCRVAFAAYVMLILIDPVLFSSKTAGVMFFLVIGSIPAPAVARNNARHRTRPLRRLIRAAP